MESISAQHTIEKAIEEYEFVMRELNRPQEDMVMIAECELIKNSIRHFLIAFLFENGEKDIPKNDLVVLQRRCMLIDKAFENLNLRPIAMLCDKANVVYTHGLKDDRLQDNIKTLEATKDLVTSLVQA